MEDSYNTSQFSKPSENDVSDITLMMLNELKLKNGTDSKTQEIIKGDIKKLHLKVADMKSVIGDVKEKYEQKV